MASKSGGNTPGAPAGPSGPLVLRQLRAPLAPPTRPRAAVCRPHPPHGNRLCGPHEGRAPAPLQRRRPRSKSFSLSLGGARTAPSRPLAFSPDGDCAPGARRSGRVGGRSVRRRATATLPSAHVAWGKAKRERERAPLLSPPRAWGADGREAEVDALEAVHGVRHREALGDPEAGRRLGARARAIRWLRGAGRMRHRPPPERATAARMAMSAALCRRRL